MTLNSPFFKLPLELRQTIYEHVFRGQAIHVILYKTPVAYQYVLRCIFTRDKLWSLPATCSAINQDVKQRIRFSHLILYLEWDPPIELVDDITDFRFNPLKRTNLKSLDNLLEEHIPAFHRAHITNLLIEDLGAEAGEVSQAEHIDVYSKSTNWIGQSLPHLTNIKPVVIERRPYWTDISKLMEDMQISELDRICDDKQAVAIQREQFSELAKKYQQDKGDVGGWWHEIYVANADLTVPEGSSKQRQRCGNYIRKFTVIRPGPWRNGTTDAKKFEILDQLEVVKDLDTDKFLSITRGVGDNYRVLFDKTTDLVLNNEEINMLLPDNESSFSTTIRLGF